jgi:hypothetical protein
VSPLAPTSCFSPAADSTAGTGTTGSRQSRNCSADGLPVRLLVAKGDPPRPSGLVLVPDDDRDMCEGYRALFDISGYRTAEAGTARM